MSNRVSKSDPLRAIFATMVATLLFATATATAQTYTVLNTYPIGAGAYSGILAPLSDVAGPGRQLVQHHFQRWN